MCHRVSPLLIAELRAALEERRRSGHARVPEREPGLEVPDAYPGRQLPLFVPGPDGGLEAVELVWGFDNPRQGGGLVFNTRIETALSQARAGRGLWAEAVARGRCLVPVRAFYERGTRLARTGVQVRFTAPGRRVLLLAGVRAGDRVSIVTTEPNGAVAPYHSRMPLVLMPGESGVWLGPGYARLADRAIVPLDAVEEERLARGGGGATLPLEAEGQS